MRNPNNKSLNDLFRSARDESNPVLVSDREAEQLLVNGTIRSLPTEQTIGQQLYERLFATPLKIGITTMTTATCIALGVFAFWPQTATNSTLASHNPLVSNGAYESQGTLKSHETAVLPNSRPLTIKPATAAYHRADALPTRLAAPIATADSLHPIELSPEQLTQLGIVLEDNGDIDFYTKSGSSGEVNKFGLPPSWGVRLHLGEKISENDLAGVTIPKSAPRLVTEPNGAKRLFSFESDTTFTNINGNRTMTMTMHSAVKIAPGNADSSRRMVNKQMVLKMFGDSNTANSPSISNGTRVFVNKEVNVRSGSNDVERKTEKLSGDMLPHWPNNTVDMSTDEETSVEVETDSTIPHQLVQYTISPKNDLNPRGNIKVDLSPGLNVRIARKGGLNGLPELDMSKIAQADSVVRGLELIMKDLHGVDMRLNLDSELNVAKISLKLAEKQLWDSANKLYKNEVRIEDSAERTIPYLNSENFPTDRASSETIQRGDTTIRKLKALGLVESDTIIRSIQLAKGIEDEDVDIDNNDDAPGIPPTPPIPPFQLMEEAANSINLDHLIPIRVRNMKNAEHPNELIFWYEPTPEVTAAIPEASALTPAQSKQLAISVYPNPTNGPANIHFHLAGAPKAYFSVRNLLGQQVLDGGTTSGSSGDMKLDLSSLEPGVYLLVTTTDGGERDVERVVVAK